MANHIVLVFMSDTPKGHKNIALGHYLFIHANRSLGQAVVPLKSACDGQPSPFSAVITHKGKECGAVQGYFNCVGVVSVETELQKLQERWDKA